jgi:hypothetical protein
LLQPAPPDGLWKGSVENARRPARVSLPREAGTDGYSVPSMCCSSEPHERCGKKTHLRLFVEEVASAVLIRIMPGRRDGGIYGPWPQTPMIMLTFSAQPAYNQRQNKRAPHPCPTA